MFGRKKNLGGRNNINPENDTELEERKYEMHYAGDLQKEYPIDYIYVGHSINYIDTFNHETLGEVEYQYYRRDFFLAPKILFRGNEIETEGVLKKLTGLNKDAIYNYKAVENGIEVVIEQGGKTISFIIKPSDNLRNMASAILPDELYDGQVYIKKRDLFAAIDDANAARERLSRNMSIREKIAGDKLKNILEREFGEEE